MTPIQPSPTLSVSNDYLSAFLSSAQEKVSSVKLAEVKTLLEKHEPRIAAFFPMRTLSFMIASSTLEDLKRSFEGLADHTEALSKTGFSVKQIVGILGRSGSYIAERADTLIKFTQPKVDSNNENTHSPSDLEYVLSSGLSHDHISSMLFGSREHLSENIKTLREFVTPSVQSLNAQGQPVLRSPLQMLEEAGLFKDNLSRIFRKFTHSLAFGINHLLSLAYLPPNIPFNEVFKEDGAVHLLGVPNTDKVSHGNEESNASEMTLEDAGELLDIFGTGKISRNNSEESFLLRDVAEATMEDANDLLDVLGTDTDTDNASEKKSNHSADPFSLSDIDNIFLDNRDYISDMFDADLDVSK